MEGEFKLRVMYVLKKLRKKKSASKKKISPMIVGLNDFLSLKIDDGRIWIIGGGEAIELTEVVEVNGEEDEGEN